MQEPLINKKLIFIDFQTLDKWYVSYYINPNSIQSSYQLVKLKELIVPKKVKIRLKDYKGDLRVVKKISFSNGKIHIREENETKMDLYILHPNDLLVSKINFHQGALAINNFEKIVCTTHYQPYGINREKVIDQYLVLALRNQFFQNHLAFLRAEGIKNEATYEFIGELEIPLPKISEQLNIINCYNKKIEEAEALQKQGENLEAEIEKYFLEQLGLRSFITKQRIYGLQVLDFSELERWDFFSMDTTIAKELKKSKFELKTIGSIYDFAKRPFNKATYKKTTFKYIEIGAIDPYKGILESKEISLNKAPSRATQLVKEGDLIIGTTRPYLKKFAIVPKLHDNDVCSSGFSVIESSVKYYLPFLLQFLKCTYGIEQLKNRMTGGLYPAITEPELKEIKIPVPTVSEQKIIMNLIESKRQSILANKEKYISIINEAKLEFEKQIFT